MEVKRFDGNGPGNGLVYQVIEPDRYQPDADYPLIVMIHGYAATMDDMAGLAPAIDPAGYIYLCPNAPISFQVRSGRVAYGWSSPSSSSREVEEEEVQAAKMLEKLFAEIFREYNVSPGRVLLMGFSQGGNLSLRCGLPRPETFAGLASLSGYLPDAGTLQRRLPAQRTQPIFVAHGTHDQYIPLEQAQEVRDFLKAQGYTPLYREYPSMRHEVNQKVMEDLTPWIKKVLPPFSG